MWYDIRWHGVATTIGLYSVGTFGDVSEFLLKRITSGSFPIIYFVTDQYKTGSIKSFDRSRQGCESSIRINIQRREQKRPKQWAKFLKDGRNKTALIEFIMKDWPHKTRFVNLILSKTIFVNVESKFFFLPVVNGTVLCTENEELGTD